MANKSVIVTCAITGSLHTPSMSPHLPLTPNAIASEAIAAAEAGAAILHLHARCPDDGRPTADPAVYMQFLPQVSAATDAVINITTGGAPGMSMDERLAAAERVSPEMTSLNMGSINVGLFQAVKGISEWRYPWERDFLERSRDNVFRNTFADIEQIVGRLGDGHGCRFEFECYDVAHLYNLAWLIKEGLYQPPLFIQFCLGIMGGIGAELDHLLHLIRTAERLFGDGFEFSVLAAGKHQMPMATHNALLGGNVRVGLEDSLRLGRGRLATSNAEQVLKIREILSALGMTIATPTDVRERLALKGRAATSF